MKVPASTIVQLLIEGSSITLFSLCEQNLLLLSGEGRSRIMDRRAKAIIGFAAIEDDSSANFSLVEGKKEIV